MSRFVRPYVRGAVTPQGWLVVCVPGMKPVEVVDHLGSRLTHLALTGRVRDAQTLLRWFGGEYSEAGDGIEGEEPLPI